MRQDIKDRLKKINNNEVPNGFQRTKAGLMPNDWVPIHTAGEIFVNHTDKKHDGTATVLSATQDRGIVPRSEVDIDIKYAEKNLSGYKKVNPGNFIISLRSFQGGIEYSEYEGLVSPAYTVLKRIMPLIDDYYKNYFKTNDFINRLNSATYGIRDGKQIGYQDFKTLILHYPPLAEQDKVAEILNHCDNMIELKQQLIEEERSRKKWLMQNLLDPDSGVRLPGFEGEWLPIFLGQVGAFSKGTGISNDDCKTGKYPCIKYGDIYMSFEEYFTLPVSYTKEEIAMLSPKISNGALLFTASGEDRLEIGKCIAYLGCNSLAVGGDIVICLPNIEEYDPQFLAYQQNTEDLIKQKSVLAQGYSIVHLYSEQIKKLKICVPPTKREQIAISNLLSAVDDKVRLLEQELNQWQQKKKALMQLLLTGIMRVSV